MREETPKKIVLTGLLTACALVVNAAEGLAPLPFPGVKLGAANVFSLVALATLGVREAFAVTLLRVFLAWFASGNVFALLCGLSGGVAAISAMSLLYKKLPRDFSMPWISVAGACSFNIGQVAVVSYIAGDKRIAFYILPLFAVGCAAGWAVGKIAEIICERIGRIGK